MRYSWGIMPQSNSRRKPQSALRPGLKIDPQQDVSDSDGLQAVDQRSTSARLRPKQDLRKRSSFVNLSTAGSRAATGADLSGNDT
jgi:hypothetical protein